MCEKRGTERLLLGKPDRRRSLVRPRGIWKDNIKMDI
jgi:hypothetical protein